MVVDEKIKSVLTILRMRSFGMLRLNVVTIAIKNL